MLVSRKSKSRFAVWLLLLLVSAAAGRRAEAQAASGYSEYYIPGNEGGGSTPPGLYYVLDQLDTNNDVPAGTNMHSVITVTAWAPNTTIYYDHWEDGLDFDPNNPSTADFAVTLTATGQVQTFESADFMIPVAARTTGTGCNGFGTCFYDGGDRIFVAGGAVTVTRAGWVEARLVGNQAVAWEIYPVKPQLTTYVLPFGENLYPANPAFQRVFALIQATADNTTFQVDLNGDGTFDLLNANRTATKSTGDGDSTTVTLNAGQTFLLDRISACTTNTANCINNPGTLNAGAVIQGSNTLQVKFVAGITTANYGTRGLSAFPRGYWTKSYYAPLPNPSTGSGTDYFLHNPHATPLVVTWESRTATGSFQINPKSTVSFVTASGGAVPTASGLYFNAPDVFWGVGLNDSTGASYEWGYSLLPSTFLYTEHFLGWAPGFVGGSGTERYDDDGVFLIPAQDNTTVFVDYDNDGTVDATYRLNRLQTQYIYDPYDGNMSGAHIWATGLFTLAYGANSDTATASAPPSLDLGYVAIPGTDFISLVLGVEKSASPQVVSTAAGSRTTFTITVESKDYAVDGVSVTDQLPPNWTYVSGTTVITLPNQTQLPGTGAEPLGLLTYADLFGATSYANNDSTPAGTTWATNWIETGESDGTDTGNVRVASDTGVSPNVNALQFRNNGATNGRAIARMADLSSFPGGTLQFDYRRRTNAAADLLAVQVCADAVAAAAPAGITCPGGWIPAPSVPGGASDAAYVSYSVDLSGLLPASPFPASFAVRFSTYTSGLANNERFWVRNVRIVPGGIFWLSSILGGMAPNQKLKITFEAETTAVLPLGTLSQNRVVATGSRTIGSPPVTQTFSATDFAYVATGDLQIAKSSDAPSPLYPGDTFGYTVTVTNPAGGATQTGVSLYDALPAGLTPSGSVTLNRSSVADSFDTAAYTNNQGTRNWTVNWTESDASGTGAGTGYIRVTGGQLRLNNQSSVATQSITRGVNLTGTGATNATLTFAYSTSNNLENVDVMTVQYRVGGSGNFADLGMFTDDANGIATYQIPLASPANLTEIRFAILSATAYTSSDEYFYVDDLSITYDQPFTTGNPPDLLSAESLYALSAGQSLTATFNVTVDNPFLAGSTMLTNVAATTTAQFPIQLTASATNQVTIPTAQSATVAGRVWFDADADGVQDVGEPGLSNVQVTLKDQFGAPIATLTTDGNGRYLFTGVPPGNGYYVEVAGGLPSGVVQSYPAGRTDNRTGAFNLTSGQSYTGADLGYKPAIGTATFGDLAWVDADGDQLKDPGEVGLGGVRVRLYRDANSNGLLEPGTDVLVGVPAAGPGTVIVNQNNTTVTGVGTQFRTLAPGDPITIGGVVYTIASIASNTQLTLSTAYAGTSGSLKPYTATTAQGPGTIQVTNESASVTGTGTAFTNLEPGDPIIIGGVKYVVATRTSDTALTLTTNFAGTGGSGLAYGVANATFTAADGSYLITGIPASGSQTYFVSAIAPEGYAPTTSGASRFQNVASGAVLLTADFGFRNDTGTFSISDRVWNDADGDRYFDGGSAEPGIGGVTVDLLDASLNVVGTTTTAADGTFTFSGLAGSGADYTIRLSDAGGVLANYSGTTPYATARERSEPNLTGNVDRRTAAAWPNGPSFGFLATRSIGDSVYIDANGNGTQDAGENGFPGVAVSLYRDVDGDGTLSLVAAGNVSATSGLATVTGTGFFNYHAGEPVMIGGVLYTIQSVTSNTTLVLTSAFGGTTGSKAFLAPEPGPGTVSVTNGQATIAGSGFSKYRAGDPITINNGAANVVYTILSVNSDTSLTLTTTYTGSTNGNRTYYGPGDALVSTVTTDSTGQYLFAGLPARDYVVSVSGPAGYNYIPGTRPDTDATTPGIQLAATITGTVNVLDRDFGFQAPAAGGIQGTLWNDADGDGVIDGNESGRYAGVTVEVLSGTTVVATLTTDANGNYSVAGLAVGSYTVRVTDAAGVLTGITATTGTSKNVTVVASTNITADFGFRPPTPTYAAVSSLKAWTAGGEVVVEWRTTQEVGTVGFDLFRLDREERRWVKVNESLLPALLGHPGGGTYTFVDEGAPASGPIAYKLVEVDARAERRAYGPWRFQGLPHGPRAAEPFLRTPAEVPAAERERVALLSREKEAALVARSGMKGERVKATTREAGLHYVDTAVLASLLGEKLPSLQGRVETGRVVVENLGAPVPYVPAPGGVGLYFYAEKLDSPYTGENAYWLAARRGTTMASTNGAPTFTTPAASFTDTVHAEVDRYPLPAAFHDPEADFYAWDYLYAGYPGEDVRTYTTTLRGVAGTGTPTLTVRLQGGSDTEAPNEHRVRVRWNGNDLGDATWDGIAPWVATFPLGPTDVVEGTNTLVVTAILEPGLGYDVVYVDSFDVSYPRLYRAVDDELSFKVPAGAEAALSGFTSPGVVLLDITSPESPLLVTGAVAWAPGDGTYGVRFANRSGAARTYLAVVPARAKSPVSLTPGRPFLLSASTNGADYLLVAPPSLLTAAEALAAYRRSRGLDTKVVDLEDVYDELGYGLATPVAIRDFLAVASAEWTKAPQYATLVGRGTFDYRDVEGVGDNLMPTLLAATPYGLVASDVSFAPLSTEAGRGLKSIGRLPVLTSQELYDYLAKVQAHEAASPASWQSNLLLTADNADVGGAFPADSDAVGDIAPASFLKTKVYLGPYTVPDARAAILGTFSSGTLLFNFIGHGAPNRLADEGILTTSDVPSLTNAGRLPVFLAMTCSAGNFAIPGFPSLSESLVLWKSGGAYVAWAPSGLSLNDGARTMNEAFFQSAFQAGEKVVGRSCTKSIESLPPAGPYAFMKSIYNVIGEPVSRLP